MRRALLVLPLCLLTAPNPQEPPAAPYTARGVADEEPATPPSAVPTPARLATMAKGDPIDFLAGCLQRGRADVASYRAAVDRQERIAGELQPPEQLVQAVIEPAPGRPFSMFVDWKQGARLAQRMLYVEGQNDNFVLAKPSKSVAFGLGQLVPYVKRAPDGPEVRESSRYALRDGTLIGGIQRTLTDWREARTRGDLRAEYRGSETVPEAGGRRCHVFHRHYPTPDAEGIGDVTVYIDAESFLQIGTRVTGTPGVIGTYFFHDVELNPTFAADQFTDAALKH